MKKNVQSFVQNVTPLILAGGLGTRLRTIVSDRSKVLADVRGRPFITYVLDQLIKGGFKQVILCVGHLAETLIATLGYEYRSLSLRYSRESQSLGTGGAVKYAMPMIKTSHILLMNGDSFIDIDLREFLACYFNRNIDMMMVLSEVADVSRYGAVIINENEIIAEFKEKTTKNNPGWVNAGIYLISKKLIEESIQSNVFYSLEKDLIPQLLKNISIGGYCSHSKLIDIGTPESYKEASQVL